MGRCIFDYLLLAASCLLLLAVAFVAGRDFERTSAAVAEPTAPILRITKNEAWDCVNRQSAARREKLAMMRGDLRLSKAAGR
jgi:hypothetical protein